MNARAMREQKGGTEEQQRWKKLFQLFFSFRLRALPVQQKNSVSGGRKLRGFPVSAVTRTGFFISDHDPD
jgi:hypothetical protein